MALIFCDGFDNYATQTEFWDFAGTDCAINTAVGAPRTGRGCLQVISSAFGPRKLFPANKTHVLGCVSINFSGAGSVMDFFNATAGEVAVRVAVLGDGSITFGWGNANNVVATTAIGLVAFGAYVSIAVEVENFTTATGIITCWVNGLQVFQQSGLKTTNTLATGSPSFCNAFRLMGPGGIPALALLDDCYVLDCSTPPNDTFLGALKLYALPPTSDVSVAWTPLGGGTNFSEVDEIPPDGDTSYVSSAAPGAVDQYGYPLTGPPVGSSLVFLQHELDMKVDSGSRSVGSDVEGIAAAGEPLTNGYKIYVTPYDVNPATGVAFVAADFPLAAGPIVTA
jgi:hypothetical protein